ncbi:S8 family serine peptidase [Anabaena sphaerica FACHB-251]|uniref:S8 family serine peptidase n=1 Tax=Anabaena sphaerica FACHB-251 TaxID=2692883 RepID=A0A926WLC9_9NOST|nr:S8 family serine peptidase [Anabaena sphaerica]MBD2296652.1 S8 family serine peptidase [Anabaena sphaerica FACHB-251]
MSTSVGANPAFDLIGLTQLRNDPQFAGIDGSGFTVAVIDTGLDGSHPQISPNFKLFADFVDGGNTPPIITTASESKDSKSHGTHVAGTVGARDPNIGVAPDVGLIGLRGIGPWISLRNVLQWVLDNRNEYNIIAVNMSLGEGSFRINNSQVESQGGILTEINDIINRLEDVGVTIVSAAGNDYAKKQIPGVAFPGISSTINVGAIWQDDQSLGRYVPGGGEAAQQNPGADRITVFSQRLDDPNDTYDTLFAPGAMIKSAVPKGGFEQWPGTSMASPHVAGAVALMQEAARQFSGRLLSPAEIVAIMRSTGDVIFDGDDENDNVTNTNTSYRRLNIYKAITEIKQRSQQIAPPPPGGGAGDPNGTIAGAYLVPTTIDGSPVDVILESIGTDAGTTQVGNKDVDIFRFEVAVAGTVNIQVGSHPNNANDFDTLLRLFNSSGTELAFDDNGGIGDFSRLEVSLNPGIYYAGVSGNNNRNYDPNVASSGVTAATGNYSLQFGLTNTDLNGLLANAVDISLGTDVDPFDLKEGFIGTDYDQFVGTGDVDLFRVIVPDNGTLYIDIDTPFETEYVNSYLRVFDEDGNQVLLEDGEPVISNDDLSFDANADTEFTDQLYPGLVFEHPTDRAVFNGHTTDSFIAGGVNRGEVYYIGVSDFANQDYNTQDLSNRSTAGTGGLYDLIVRFANNDRNGSIAQAVSDISLPITGQPGIIGDDTDPQTGESFQVGDLDIDFVKIRSATAGILEIDIDSYENTEITTPVDTVLSIFDAQGNLLAENDDTNGVDPVLLYQITANTDYFVAVSGYGNSNFDPFMLGSGSPGDTGEYIFNSRLLSTNEVIGTLSNDAINYSLVQNQPVTIDSPVFANIGSDNDFVIGASDIDIYRFVANFSGKVGISTNTSQPFSADTFLRFFDADGNEIAFNDDENDETLGSYLEVQVTNGNEYYIGVNGYSPDAGNYDPITGSGAAAGSEGDYTLMLSSIQPPSPTITFGSNGDDLIISAPNQILFTGAGADEVDLAFSGQPENSRVSLGSGNDRIYVSQSDRAFGGSGNDVFDATDGQGENRMSGGAGNDIFFLGTGDRALGGDGDDTFFVQSGGENLIAGGAGADKFWITTGEIPASANTITDYQLDFDSITVEGIINIDVLTSGISTQLRVGDGIADNTGFGTGALLATLSGTSGLTSADVNVNLFGANFLFN